MALPNLLVDGFFMRTDALAWQRHMAYEGFYTGYIDGDFGILSQTALQSQMKYHGYYGGYIDGDFGSMSKRALHNYVIGHWGMYTYVRAADQAQIYRAPWDPRGGNDTSYIENVTKAVENGLNLYGVY